jgi:ribosome-binding factor A
VPATHGTPPQTPAVHSIDDFVVLIDHAAPSLHFNSSASQVYEIQREATIAIVASGVGTLPMESRLREPTRFAGCLSGNSIHSLGEIPISNTHRTRKPDRKLLQLCSQVADTLNQVLSGECGDDVLRSLYVVSVAPAPDAAQLLVVVAPVLTGDPIDPVDVLGRLSSHAGPLRHAVATSITRRRAPRLLYQVDGSNR